MSTSPSVPPVLVSSRDRVAAAVVTGLLLAVAVAAAGYGLITLVAAAKEILVAVIAACASLLSAVFAYVFTRAKDIELATLQKQRELEAAERKTKQENYARILERLAPYVRSRERGGDDFTTAYLQAWVTGSVAVVEAANAFLKDASAPALDALLRAMRDDLTLEKWGSDQAMRAITTQGLFPSPKPPEGLGAGIGRGAAVGQPAAQ